jgi:predicted acyltransferase
MARTVKESNKPTSRFGISRPATSYFYTKPAVPTHARDRIRDKTVAAPLAPPQRVASVDALRGFAMIWILGADAVAWQLNRMAGDSETLLASIGRFLGTQFEHVDWEGFRFYDLVLPLFIFVTGVSIVFSLPRLVAREGMTAAHARVLRRSLLLFGLGIIYYGGVSYFWPEIRLLGVLQRIALCYLAASLLFLHLSLRGLLVAFATLLVGYWALMTFVPVPEIGAGSFAKGENLANWIDAYYLPGWKFDGAWDPEGLLSTLPAIATCLLGVFAGLLLKTSRLAPEQKPVWLLAGGVVLVAMGHLWGLQFPVVKKIWTSSFVLVAGGYSLILLGAFYQVIDLWRRSAWATVLMWIGANAILLYFLNNIVGFHKVAQRLAGGDVARIVDAQLTHGAGDLLVTMVGIALAILLARYLYRKQIFLRV